jgi:CDP-glycerol glycerophosphotransferase (TagB/SpsB family)
VNEYQPHAVIVPGNVVPYFWPGLKVQIFHGLGEEKRGHYRINELFDLYCTPGPVMTEKFEKLALKHGSFLVKETGWPKLDNFELKVDRDLRKTELGINPEQPVILYAPTFSSRYTSARDLFEEIQMMIDRPYHWLIKFHTLMDQDLSGDYLSLNKDYVTIIDNQNIIPYMEISDILLTDTSSVAYEFLILNRPIITYRAGARLGKGVNILKPYELFGAIVRSLEDPDEFAENRKFYLEELHPYNDGHSSHRVLKAIDEVIGSGEFKRLTKRIPAFGIRRKLKRLVQ